MNPYRDYMAKQAGFTDMLGHVAKFVGSVSANPAVKHMHAIVSNPVVRTTAAVGIPAAVMAGKGIVDHFKVERSWASLQEEINRTPSLASVDRKLLREVFNTVAQGSPHVASNPLLAISALKQWANNNAGMRQFDLGSFSQLQGINKGFGHEPMHFPSAVKDIGSVVGGIRLQAPQKQNANMRSQALNGQRFVVSRP